MEILLTEVAEKHNIILDNLKDFLIVNSDIFHFIRDELSEEIYLNKYDSEDLIFLYQKLSQKASPNTGGECHKEHNKQDSSYNSILIIEEYLNSFFENEKKVKDCEQFI